MSTANIVILAILALGFVFFLIAWWCFSNKYRKEEMENDVQD